MVEESMADYDVSLIEFEERVKVLVEQGRYCEAMQYYDEHCVEAHSNQGDPCRLYSFRIMGVCRFQDIKDQWDTEGRQLSKWMETGNTLFEQGNYHDAIEAHHKAIKENEQDHRARYAIGCAYRAIGNPYESLEAWDMARSILNREKIENQLEVSPDEAPAWAALGDLDFLQEHYRLAIHSYIHSVEIDPGNFFVWFRQGCSHYEREDYENALACFTRSLELNPDDRYAWNNKGATLCCLGRHHEAVEAFDQAICIQGKGPETLGDRSIGNNRKKAMTFTEGEPQRLVLMIR